MNLDHCESDCFNQSISASFSFSDVLVLQNHLETFTKYGSSGTCLGDYLDIGSILTWLLWAWSSCIFAMFLEKQVCLSPHYRWQSWHPEMDNNHCTQGYNKIQMSYLFPKGVTITFSWRSYGQLAAFTLFSIGQNQFSEAVAAEYFFALNYSFSWTLCLLLSNSLSPTGRKQFLCFLGSEVINGRAPRLLFPKSQAHWGGSRDSSSQGSSSWRLSEEEMEVQHQN